MKNEVWIDGAPLCASFGLVLMSCEETEPAPKTYVVNIPGGNGVLDLTESLSGDTAYQNREFRFVLAAFDGRVELSRILTRLRSFLHGKRLTFAVSWDEGYEYIGRFSVAESARVAKTSGTITLAVDAEPYKLKETCTYRVNAAGGIMIALESGRMPVCPTFEFASETIVACGDTYAQMQPGSYKVNDLWLHEGINEIYLNSYLGDGNVTAERYQDDTIAMHADERISDLIWEGVRGAALTIEDLVNDTIAMHADDLIIDTAHAVSTDTEEFAVYINYPWKDL